MSQPSSAQPTQSTANPGSNAEMDLPSTGTAFVVPEEAISYHLKVADQLALGPLDREKIETWLSYPFALAVQAYRASKSQKERKIETDTEPEAEVQIQNPFMDLADEWAYWQVVEWQAQQACQSARAASPRLEERGLTVWHLLLSEIGLRYITKCLKIQYGEDNY